MTDTPAPAPILTPEQEAAVIAAVGAGARTLKRACKAEGMPRPWQVLAHAKADASFAARLDTATEAVADEVHDEVIAIEGRVLRGKIEPAAANAALSSKRWRLQRLDRRRFGDKVEAEVKGDVKLEINLKRFTPSSEPNDEATP